MKYSIVSAILLLLLNLSMYSQGIDEKLSILDPFLGKTWKGDFKLPDGTIESVVVRNFEAMPGGKVIKIIKKNEGKGNVEEGYFYWDDIAKKIAYFNIGNNGVFNTGFVNVQGNTITIEGKMTWPNQQNPKVKQSYDFKNTFEFSSEKAMTDKWFQNAFGAWMPGHVIEFTATDN